MRRIRGERVKRVCAYWSESRLKNDIVLNRNLNNEQRKVHCSVSKKFWTFKKFFSKCRTDEVHAHRQVIRFIMKVNELTERVNEMNECKSFTNHDRSRK